MQNFGQPVVILKTSKKLHISKTPGIFSWAALIASGYVGDVVASFFFTDEEVFYRFLVAFLSIACALWKMETWEDLVVDRETCLVTFLMRNWYHCLWVKVPACNIKRFSTSCVTCVLVSDIRGIDIVQNDGSVVVLAEDCTNIRKLRDIRKEISTFLHLELMEELPHDYYWNAEYLWSTDDMLGDDEEVPVVSDTDTDTLDTGFDSQNKT